jgi:extracellular elastinolytic metalloproteinase
VNQAGQGVTGVNVDIGDYEARVTPSAITAGRTGQAFINMVPGTYDVTLQAPGWGSRTITGVTITAARSPARS